MWRRAMTRTFLRTYLQRPDGFYKATHAVENPDQRIFSDIKSFCDPISNTVFKMLTKLVVAAGFLSVLWERSHVLLYACAALSTRRPSLRISSKSHDQQLNARAMVIRNA